MFKRKKGYEDSDLGSEIGFILGILIPFLIVGAFYSRMTSCLKSKKSKI